jgi:hypothetical protein
MSTDALNCGIPRRGIFALRVSTDKQSKDRSRSTGCVAGKFAASQNEVTGRFGVARRARTK